MLSTSNLKKTFAQLAEQWKKDTAHWSSISNRAEHPAYVSIIELGPDVVPLILEDLQVNGPDHWFLALLKITEENPVSSEVAGNMQAMTEAWLAWGRKIGYI